MINRGVSVVRNLNFNCYKLFINLKSKLKLVKIFASKDAGFKWGNDNQFFYTICRHNFPENYMKMKKIGPGGCLLNLSM